MSNAVFSYLGAELVGITVGEAQNPRKAIPRAVRLTFFRIVFFYLVLILLLGMNVPYNSPALLTSAHEAKGTVSADASPFVVAATLAGVNVLPSLINVCLLIFTFSAANSDLYIATRSLYSLAIEGNAPHIFSRTNDRGVPIYALGLSSLCCLSAYMSVKVGAFTTFQYFVSLVTIFGILTWISILISHIYFVRARKAQGIPNTALAYVSPFGVRGSMAALIFACIITFFNGWADFLHYFTSTEKFDHKNFIVDYLPVPIYLAMFFGYKFIMKTEVVKAVDADLVGGKARIDEDEEEFLAQEMRRKGGMLETKWERLYRITLGNFF
jgi:amino acid transporter